LKMGEQYRNQRSSNSMTHSRKIYARSPIVEAVLDLRVSLPESATLNRLKEFCESVKNDYPTISEQFSVSIRIGSPTIAEPAPQHGYLARNQVNTQVIQAQTNGFSFSRLSPYERWEPFRDESRRLWTIYQSLLDPLCINRAALRYINKIELPINCEISDFLNLHPALSPSMPQRLEGFSVRIQLTHHDIQSVSLINESTVSTTNPDIVPVLLDMDLFRIVELPKDESELWVLIEALHAKQNDLFEACITDRVRELIA
jgi:uncharacterized protein (TIGR04255 family)